MQDSVEPKTQTPACAFNRNLRLRGLRYPLIHRALFDSKHFGQLWDVEKLGLNCFIDCLAHDFSPVLTVRIDGSNLPTAMLVARADAGFGICREVFQRSLKSQDHILDGNYVIFKLTQDARAGDLIIALTPDGLTVKYIFPQSDGRILLKGANSHREDQIWEARHLKIQGVVRRIERDL